MVYKSTDFDFQGGMIGFAPGNDYGNSVDDLTLKADRDENGSYETTEHIEAFTLDSNGYANETMVYDAGGNLTYDGVYQYAYDAWNRLVKVTKAHRDPGSPTNPTAASLIDTMRYDGTGRRISKAVTNSADMDATFHYYFNGQSTIEERNGSDAVIKQFVWNTTNGGYIDELVQVANNRDPVGDPDFDPDSAYYSPRYYYALHNANYNVIGLVLTGTGSGDGSLVERYEYTPYGQRIVFTTGGSSDTGLYSPTFTSDRVFYTEEMIDAPYGLCEVGHQGLFHEEELAQGQVIYNQARHLHAQFGRFMQRDPLGYIDGLCAYLPYLSKST